MHVDSLEDLKAFHQLFQDEGVKEERIITHGNTASIYFRDPENNYLEVYYSIPVDFPQPFGAPIDLELDDDALLQQISDLARGEREGVGVFKDGLPFQEIQPLCMERREAAETRIVLPEEYDRVSAARSSSPAAS